MAIIFGIPVVVFLLVAVVGAVFLATSPEFGGSPSEPDKSRYQKTGYYAQDKFINQIDTNLDMSLSAIFDSAYRMIRGTPNREPGHLLKVLHPDPASVAVAPTTARVIWFGHSAFLLQIDGKSLLLDPMFGPVCAPHPWLGKSRFTEGLPLEIADLPEIDAILISHDHYDHLDYGSIKALMAKTKEFYVPLGVGAHLRAWGVPAQRVHELAWDEQATLESLQLSFLPARHFSGRALSDRFATLWGSWAIRGSTDNLFFSGDSGYGPHFAEIGRKHGPFDLALIECGQYDVNWAQIHMMPEQSAQAAIDLRTRTMMPIHWGAFVLSLHAWTDPIERVAKAAHELNMPLVAPRIGEIVEVRSPSTQHPNWWREE